MAIRLESAGARRGDGYVRGGRPATTRRRNPRGAVSKTVVRALLDRLRWTSARPPRARDGAHTAYLALRGHRVAGVDATAEMSEKRRASACRTRYLRQGRLAHWPFRRGSSDLRASAAHSDVRQLRIGNGIPSWRECCARRNIVLSDLHRRMLISAGGFSSTREGAPGSTELIIRTRDNLDAYGRAGLVVRRTWSRSSSGGV